MEHLNDIRKWVSEQVGKDVEVAYENYNKIKENIDVGVFMKPYVLSGGIATRDLVNNREVNVSEISVSIYDDIMYRKGTSFKVKKGDISSIFYLDFTKDGDFKFGKSHPPGVVNVDYLTIAEVSTTSEAIINAVVDKREHIGGFRLKDEYKLEGYVTENELEFEVNKIDSDISDLSDTVDANFATLDTKIDTEVENIDLIKADKTALDITNANVLTKVDKGGNEQVTYAMLAQDVKTAITGGSTAVVGTNAVNTSNIVDNATSYVKRTRLGNVSSVNCTKTPANYDTVNNTLTIYAGTVVTHGRGNYEIPTGTNVVLDLIGTGSLHKKIVFETVTNTFYALPYNDYTSVEIENCLFLGTINNFTNNRTANLVFDYTINGVQKILNIANSIPTTSLTRSSKVSRIICNASGQYPNYSTSDSKFTFYNDTILVLQNGEYYILPETVIDLSSYASSALRVYYDTTNDNFTVRAYSNTVNETNFVFVFAIRRQSGIVSIDCPYTVNGKLFGLNFDGTIKNPLGANVKAVMHRGYSYTAPENTLPAYELAESKGFSYYECDLRFTADNIPVLLHDATINRTSNGTGFIVDLTLAEVLEYDFGSWKSAVYAGTKIMTFEDFILFCKKMNGYAYIDLSSVLTNEQAELIVGMVRRLGMIKSVSWITFNITNLQKILIFDPNARVGLNSGFFNTSVINSAVGLKNGNNTVFLNIDAPALTQELIEESILQDVYVETYTVNMPERVNGYVEMGVNGITTDLLNVAEIMGKSY